MTTLASLLLWAVVCAPRCEAQAGAEFLRFIPAARPTGMGEAYVAVAQGVGAQSLNPAGLAQGRGMTLGFTHTQETAGQRQEAVAVIAGSDAFMVGGQLTYATIDLEVTDSFGVSRPANAADVVVSLSVARRVAGVIFAGVTGKTYTSTLLDQQAQGLAMDAGVLLPLYAGWKAGFAVGNLGPPIDYGGGGDPLPRWAKAGIAYAFRFGEHQGPPALASVEWHHAMVDGELSGWNLGAEFGVARGFFVRWGFSTVRERTRSSFGASLSWGPAAVHYSLVPRSEVGLAHRLSLELQWDPTEVLKR